MGYDYSIFVDPVPTRLVCPYCQQVYRRPKTGSCDHILCLECWIVTNGTVSCPLCPEEWDSIFYLSGEHPYEAEIGKLLTQCEVFRCFETVALSQRNDHINDCSHFTVYKKRLIPISDASITDSKVESRTKKRLKLIKKLVLKYTISLCMAGVVSAVNIPGWERSDLSEEEQSRDETEARNPIEIDSIDELLEIQ